MVVGGQLAGESGAGGVECPAVDQYLIDTPLEVTTAATGPVLRARGPEVAGGGVSDFTGQYPININLELVVVPITHTGQQVPLVISQVGRAIDFHTNAL